MYGTAAREAWTAQVTAAQAWTAPDWLRRLYVVGQLDDRQLSWDMLGAELLPLVTSHPAVPAAAWNLIAGKITAMLLEYFEDDEILDLFEAPDALYQLVIEAIHVLDHSDSQLSFGLPQGQCIRIPLNELHQMNPHCDNFCSVPRHYNHMP
jgi:hypothetical protein